MSTPPPDSPPVPRETPEPAWIELRVEVPVGWQELVALTLQEVTGTTALLSEVAPIPSPGEAPSTQTVRASLPAAEDCAAVRQTLAAALGSLARRTGCAELEGLEVGFHGILSQDFSEAWKRIWKPFRVGRLCMIPAWTEPELRDSDLALKIVPGGVFGTGRHASTRSCLRMLQHCVRPGDRVLDAGSGTGVLAVAALLLGAREALGFDVDPNAEASARSLATLNGVDERARFLTGGFDSISATPTFDGVVANLYADLLQHHAGDVARRLRPGGWFLWSGIHRRHRRETCTSARDVGLVIREEREAGAWCTVFGNAAQEPER